MNFAFYVSGNAGTLKKILKNNSPVLKDTKVVIIDSKPSKDLFRYLETLIDVFKNKIINFHPSILPLYPGVKSIDQAIKDDKSILIGNTAHFIDKGIDTGPIIIQSIAPKSLFKSKGYDGIINLQLPMLDFIYEKLLKNKITIKDNKVTVNNTTCEPQFF